MRRLAAVLATALLAGLGPAAGGAAAPHVVTVADPPANTVASSGFVAACFHMSASQADNQACDSEAVPDFDRARAAEGVKPLVLPDDFDTLSVPMQVLTITNLERIDRGLPPAPGLSSRLDALAQQGADANTDPSFPTPFDGTSARSNWGDGDSALFAAFRWMYDDGPGSGNLDCVNAGDPGCWGHRHTVLDSYDSPIAMGAAYASTGSGGSITEELVGGDSTDVVDQSPTWAEISGTLTYGVAPENISLSTPVGTSKTAVVTATSAGGSGHLEVGFESGAPTWSVSPTECDLAPNASCRLELQFDPISGGRFPGVLTVSDGSTVKTVALSGVALQPLVHISANRTRLTAGQSVKIHAYVDDETTGEALPGVRVELQRRGSSAFPWGTVAHKKSGSAGKATFKQLPTRTENYRLIVRNPDGTTGSRTGKLKIVVR